jgi:hypothetical protein
MLVISWIFMLALGLYKSEGIENISNDGHFYESLGYIVITQDALQKTLYAFKKASPDQWADGASE